MGQLNSIYLGRIPANTKRLPSVGLMLGRRRKRWPTIKPTLGERPNEELTEAEHRTDIYRINT